jgi:signal transduction histidine kinase
VRVGVGASGEAASERRVIEVADVFADPGLDDWRDVATELGFRALVALPLQTAAGVLGTITFYFASGSSLTPESRGLLRVVADQMAATTEKASLISELQRGNTELEKQNQALLEARRLQDEFLANISHELRTPLTSVLGYLALIEEGVAGPVTDEQGHTLAQVKASSEKLLGLIGDLLDLTTLKRGELPLHVAEVDPRGPVNDALASLREHKDSVKVISENGTGPALPAMKSDGRKVARLISALVNNAVKFTDQGEVRVTVDVQGDRVRYRVVDTGVGIGPDAIAFVFDDFRQEDGSATRRHGGSGLGLSIARRLARLLGGDVTVSSERGKGSTFIVDLPRELAAGPDA